MTKISHYISIPGLTVDKKSRIPAYQQVYELLRGAIMDKRLVPGQRLPSSRILAEDMGVSRNIILPAYEQLALEGYITGKTGSGSFVAKNIKDIPPDFPNRKKLKKNNLINEPAHSNPIRFEYPLSDYLVKKESMMAEDVPFENPAVSFDHFPYKSWIRCANKIFRSLEFLNLGYNDAQGYYPLREAIAFYLKTNRALNCGPGQIVIVNGTQQGLNLVAGLLINKGKQFWMEDPGYVNAKAAFEHYGGEPCFIPNTKNGFNLDFAIRRYPEASLVFLTPSHQYPSGGAMPINKRLQLLDWAAKNKMWIIEDDYDSEFRYSPSPIPSLQGLDKSGKVIYMGTFSKVLFPGIRIGYLVLPDEQMAKTFTYAKAFADRQNPITDQMVLNEFIRMGYFSIHLRKMRVLYKRRLDFLTMIINKYGKGIIRAESKNCGMHLIAWLDEKADAKKIAALLREVNIVTAPLSLFSFRSKMKPALILGFAAFNEKALKESALKMIKTIKDNT